MFDTTFLPYCNEKILEDDYHIPAAEAKQLFTFTAGAPTQITFVLYS